MLVISHHAGDEGFGYLEQLRAQAARVGVPMIYAAQHFSPQAEATAGRFTLWDAYVHADFVTYPSLIEGFGNALLETLYFRLPALVNRYPVYAADIAPLASTRWKLVRPRAPPTGRPSPARRGGQ